MSHFTYQVSPGRQVGPFALGVTLHDTFKILSRFEHEFSSVNLVYSTSEPLTSAVLVQLPENGLQLRFDGGEQNLRIIEITDFTKAHFKYGDYEIFRPGDTTSSKIKPTGPSYRSVSKLFGPTFDGEYLPAYTSESIKTAVYILSYPGVAFSFPVDAASWSSQKDRGTFLKSAATSAATSLAVFRAQNWTEARTVSNYSRSDLRKHRYSSGTKEDILDSVVTAELHGQGRIKLLRASGAPIRILLSETTPQDLISELGPPDAIYRKHDRRLEIHKARTSSHSGHDPTSPREGPDLQEDDNPAMAAEAREAENLECFYNYFRLGLDFLISYPTNPSPPCPGLAEDPSEWRADNRQAIPKNLLTTTKVILHGNVPGTPDFGKYRRIQFVLKNLAPDPDDIYEDEVPVFDSETGFDAMRETLNKSWASLLSENAEQRMVLNRGWTDSPSSSCEFLGGWEEEVATEMHIKGGQLESNINDTSELHGYPGMIFEVVSNGCINSLTVY